MHRNISFLSKVLIVAGAAFQYATAPAASISLVPAGQSSYEVDVGGKPMPYWNNGALAVLDLIADTAPPSVSLFDREGRKVSTRAFPIPGAVHTTVRHFIHGPDGSIALCGSVLGSEGRGTGYLGWISADGATIQIVRPAPYSVTRVAFASDGTIWTTGIEERNFSAPVFRRFDRSGEMLGAFLPGTEFRNYPSSFMSSVNVFGTIGDHAVWYSQREGELVEVSPSGEVRRTPVLALPDGEAEAGFAITEDGEIFVSSRGNSSASLSRLDRGLRAWVPVVHDNWSGQTPRPSLYLYGAEGNTLVVRDYRSPTRYLKYFTVQ